MIASFVLLVTPPAGVEKRITKGILYIVKVSLILPPSPPPSPTHPGFPAKERDGCKRWGGERGGPSSSCPPGWSLRSGMTKGQWPGQRGKRGLRAYLRHRGTYSRTPLLQPPMACNVSLLFAIIIIQPHFAQKYVPLNIFCSEICSINHILLRTSLYI